MTRSQMSVVIESIKISERKRSDKRQRRVNLINQLRQWRPAYLRNIGRRFLSLSFPIFFFLFLFCSEMFEVRFIVDVHCASTSAESSLELLAGEGREVCISFERKMETQRLRIFLAFRIPAFRVRFVLRIF